MPDAALDEFIQLANARFSRGRIMRGISGGALAAIIAGVDDLLAGDKNKKKKRKRKRRRRKNRNSKQSSPPTCAEQCPEGVDVCLDRAADSTLWGQQRLDAVHPLLVRPGLCGERVCVLSRGERRHPARDRGAQPAIDRPVRSVCGRRLRLRGRLIRANAAAEWDCDRDPGRVLGDVDDLWRRTDPSSYVQDRRVEQRGYATSGEVRP